jgi:hypothetical protein
MVNFFKQLHIAAVFLTTASVVAAASPPARTEYKIDKVPSWVTPVAPDLSAPLSANQPSGGVSYLLVDRQFQVKGKSRQFFSHIATKILNESGLENTSNIEIRFDPSYQTLLLHTVNVRRGERTIQKLNPTAIKILQRESSLEQLIFDGTKTANLFLEDVRVGDVVEYAYTVIGSNPVFGNQHYGRFDLQWSVPVQHVYARLLTEPGREPAIKLANTQQRATVRTSNGFQEHEWSLKDVAGIRYKDDTPAWYDPVPNVQWSDFKDWNAVAQWAVPLYKTPSQPPAAIVAEAERIRKTISATEDQAAEALRYVQKTVRYLGVEVGPGSHAPSPPDLVLSRRFGDCKDKTLLTLTLLKALGIDAQAALVSSKKRQGVADMQASPGAFDHVIVHAKIGDQTYWLDPTLPPQPGGIQDISQAAFGFAMVLDPTQQGLTAMGTGPATTYTRKVLTVFDSSGGWQKPVPFTVTSYLDGLSAERMRSTLAKESAENLQQKLTNYFARYYTGIQVVRPFEVRDNKASNQVVMTEYYLIPDFWKTARNDRAEAYAAIPDIHDFLKIPQNTVRTEPMALAHPMDISQTTYLLVPKKWTLKDAKVKVSDAVFEFQSDATFEPGRLTMVDRYRTLSDAIEPQNMASYLANAKKARDALGYSITRSTKVVD